MSSFQPSRTGPGLVIRKNLCLSEEGTTSVLLDGESAFPETLRKHFSIAENNAGERLIELKGKLRSASTHDFWQILMEEMTDIAGAQFGFVAKRILYDDQDSAIEMPPLGEPGSCLMGLAFYCNNGRGTKMFHRDYKYMAYGAPCAHMRHDKVFLIPGDMAHFIPTPNNFPFPTEAYLGIPLFSEGKCFAHFGVMWTPEGAAARQLSWGYLEMFLHSLEDLILDRVLEGKSFVESNVLPPKVVPHKSVSAAQSLKPYARSLSHELRTPMQGVVGMLDVMMATVQEAAELQTDEESRKVFQNLRENIEVVQDSSRRAVEAADNVVHAYDLNMEIPDTPVQAGDDVDSIPEAEKRPDILIEGHNIPFNPPANKRRRSDSAERQHDRAKKSRPHHSPESSPYPDIASPHSEGLKQLVRETGEFTSSEDKMTATDIDAALIDNYIKSPLRRAGSIGDSDMAFAPGTKHTKIRGLLQLVINESLQVGGRPDSASAEETEFGEKIEVWSKNQRGDAKLKVIEWSVDPAVPESISVDERDIAKLISCVFLNAIKFTDKGKITLKTTLSPRSRYIVINVIDTGPGIPPGFIPNLFKAFSQGDDSRTRQKEGLGLGLLVGRGLVRKMGGDIKCVRSDVEGPNRGTDFEIRIPVTPSEANSAPGTPPPITAPDSTVARFLLDDSARRASVGEIIKHGTFTATPHLDSPGLARPAGPKPTSSPSTRPEALTRRDSINRAVHDRKLAEKHPLTFLVAEDNHINRKLLVSMLAKLGYRDVYQAYDGADAVRQMDAEREGPAIDVVLMDLWMPFMDGYEATQKILKLPQYLDDNGNPTFTVLAVSADVTAAALERAAEVGIQGFMTKPYKLLDLQRLILEYCAKKRAQPQ
ncbi:MAG: hypothetical protein M1829_003056 [Trizodia sp. TS-e1964]|nr:MAG: hypothetical protein M1829_003056 [Trizodia sp. TS-e1964]